MLSKCLLNLIHSFSPNHRDNYRPVMTELLSLFQKYPIMTRIDALLVLLKHMDVFCLNKRVGSTGYIDFIHDEEISCAVHGNDIHGRPFCALKIRVMLDDGTWYNTFSTFFQRYIDCKQLWVCCGHHGINLFDSQGGLDALQMSLLVHVLTYKQRFISKSENEHARFIHRDSDYSNMRVCKLKLS